MQKFNYHTHTYRYKGKIALCEKLLELAYSLLGNEIIENLNFIEDINF